MLAPPLRKRSSREFENADDLWLGLRRGQKESLSELYSLFYKRLYNYGCQMVVKEEVVKDSIQELFLTLWESRKQISEAYAVKSYLFTSLKRIIFRKQKKLKNRNNRNKKYMDNYFEDAFNIEEMMIRFEREIEHKQQLAESLRSLTGRQKEAIYLKFREGLSTDETAYIMQINKQSVYNHMSKAISNMQTYVKV